MYIYIFERPHLYFKRLLNYIRDYGNRVVIKGKRKRWVIILYIYHMLISFVAEPP
jgi:hypothetical protein